MGSIKTPKNEEKRKRGRELLTSRALLLLVTAIACGVGELYAYNPHKPQAQSS